MQRSVHDVAQHVLDWQSMSAMKLQKLVYYSQAWYLAAHEGPLFADPIEAWANGPVVRELYNEHRGQYTLTSWPLGDPADLDQDSVDVVDRVLRTYGGKSAQWLSEATHAEEPWQEARRGLPESARSEAEITVDSMRRYYRGLASSGHTPETRTGAI